MRDIKGYEGLYAITSCGRVWGYKRKAFLNPAKVGKGYLQVDLYKNGVRKKHYIHQLVAAAYLPNPNGLVEVNHLNENKEDNYINNLQWISHKDNINYGTCKQRISQSLKRR